MNRLLLFIVCSVIAGCATVLPYEREQLADPAMTFGADVAATEHAEHARTNREGTSGAETTVGGGCGCN